MKVISLADHECNRAFPAWAVPGVAGRPAIYRFRAGYVAALGGGKALQGYFRSLGQAKAAQDAAKGIG